MNSEHHPPDPGVQREYHYPHGESHHRPDESRLVISRLLSSIEDARVRNIITDSYLDHGSPFAAYLMLPGVDPVSQAGDLTDGFRRRYKTSWATLAEIVDDHAEALGWDDALDAFCTQNRIPDRLITWDKDEFITWLGRSIDLIPLDGQWHVFSETEDRPRPSGLQPTERRCHPRPQNSNPTVRIQRPQNRTEAATSSRQ